MLESKPALPLPLSLSSMVAVALYSGRMTKQMKIAANTHKTMQLRTMPFRFHGTSASSRREIWSSGSKKRLLSADQPLGWSAWVSFCSVK
jgi:hypothetical protein